MVTFTSGVLTVAVIRNSFQSYRRPSQAQFVFQSSYFIFKFYLHYIVSPKWAFFADSFCDISVLGWHDITDHGGGLTQKISVFTRVKPPHTRPTRTSVQIIFALPKLGVASPPAHQPVLCKTNLIRIYFVGSPGSSQHGGKT